MSQVAISGNASGTGVFTIAAPNSNNNYTATLAAGTGTVVLDTLAQTLTNKTLTSPVINTPTMGGSVITSGTAVASTSGTSIDFTSIPSWVKRITVMFNAVSLSGTSYPVIQAGAGSITTTGYVASSTLFSTGGINSSRQTTFFAINPLNNAATDTYYGALTLSSFGSNQWVATGIFNTGSGTDLAMFVSGVVSLSGTLDRVRITTANGTDAFDAGSVNILYE